MKAGWRAIGSLVIGIAVVLATTSVPAQRAEAIVGGTASDPADYPYFVEVNYISGIHARPAVGR